MRYFWRTSSTALLTLALLGITSLASASVNGPSVNGPSVNAASLNVASISAASISAASISATAGGAAAPAGFRTLTQAEAPNQALTQAQPQPIVGINSVDPSEGSMRGGFVVTVTGVGFVPDRTTVRICGLDLPAGSVRVNTAGNSLTFTAPSCAAGQTQLLVSTPTGSASTVFVYDAEATLPVTGNSLTLPIIVGAALIVTGGLALLLFRRRSSRPSRH